MGFDGAKLAIFAGLFLTLGLAVFLFLEVEAVGAVVVTVAVGVSILVFFKTEWAVYLLIFSMLLSPELLLEGVQTSQRDITFRFDDILIVIISLSWLLKCAIYKDLKLIRATPLNLPILLYVVACVVPTIVGVAEDRVEFLSGLLFVLKYIQYFVLFFMFVNSIDDERKVRRFWTAMLITAGLVAVIGLVQIPAGGRVTAPFEGESAEPNTLGGYLGFVTLICAGMAATISNRVTKIGYVLLIVLLFIPLLFTQSRSSYIAFVAGFLTILFFTRSLVAVVSVATVALFFALFPQFLPEVISERVVSTWGGIPAENRVQIARGVWLDPAASARFNMLQSAVEALPEHPLIGFGVTGWRFLDSMYLRAVIETGLVGLLAFLFLTFRLLQLGWQRYREFKPEQFFRGLSLGFLGGLVCLLVHSLGANTFIIVRIMEPFWLVTAFVFVSAEVVRRVPEEKRTYRFARAAA